MKNDYFAFSFTNNDISDGLGLKKYWLSGDKRGPSKMTMLSFNFHKE